MFESLKWAFHDSKGARTTMASTSAAGGAPPGPSLNTMSSADIIDVGNRLDVDPLVDTDLTWIIQEYLEAPLPEGWTVVKTPDGAFHYINTGLKLEVGENPIEPRFRKLVELMKRSKAMRLPMDETTLLELLDPVERVADVKEMAEYMGIDITVEAHLLWLAKLAVLEALPEGWEEVETEDGRILYINTDTETSTEEHPNDAHFKDLLERERNKRPPHPTLTEEAYEWPTVHYRNDRDAGGNMLRTEMAAATGTWLDFYDVYGRRFWYDLGTERVTMDIREVKYIPSIVFIQRIWRGYLVRRELWQLHIVAKKICSWWRTYKFRKVLSDLQGLRDRSIRYLQRRYRDRMARIRHSKDIFRKLGQRGSRPGRRTDYKVEGLLASGYSFRPVRQAVIRIQRAFRIYRMVVHGGEGGATGSNAVLMGMFQGGKAKTTTYDVNYNPEDDLQAALSRNAG